MILKIKEALRAILEKMRAESKKESEYPPEKRRERVRSYKEEMKNVITENINGGN